MNPTIFIVNPTSSSGRTAKRFEKLGPLINGHFDNAQVLQTKGRGNATQLARTAIKNGASLIVAVGGDGTVNEVVNGFFENGLPINPRCALAVLMSGTGGDFRRSIDWPCDIAQGLARIKDGTPKPVDVGLVQATQSDGSNHSRYFINCASLGITALAAGKVRNEHGNKNRFAYLRAGMKALKAYKAPTLRTIVNGQEMALDKVSFLAFANARYFAGGIHIAPSARLDDGLADVICAKNLSFTYMLLNAYRAYFGTHLSLKRFSNFKTKSMSVETSGAEVIFVETDGEPCGQLPATFEILENALLLVKGLAPNVASALR